MKDYSIGLDPCPFCNAVYVYVYTDDDENYYVGCNTCEAQGSHCPTKRGAIKAWNK